MSEHCERLCSLCSTNEQDEQLVFSLYIETKIRLSYKSCSIYFKSWLIVTIAQATNSYYLNDCLHCLKTSTNLFNNITFSNIFYESTSVTL